MNFQLLEKTVIPLLFATLFVVGFHWQFTDLYSYLIEHFKSQRLSILYAHLFIYSFLILSSFIFLAIVFNKIVLKSKLFIAFTSIMLLLFYVLSYKVFRDSFSYFVNYPLSSNAIMGMVLFVIGTITFALYPFILALLKRSIPLSHAIIFFLLTLLYAALFIDTYCYPIENILTEFDIKISNG